jgi:hypothetical protein
LQKKRIITLSHTTQVQLAVQNRDHYNAAGDGQADGSTVKVFNMRESRKNKTITRQLSANAAVGTPPFILGLPTASFNKVLSAVNIPFLTIINTA